MSITITITIDHHSDAYEALELVGDCLSKGWQVSTTVSRPEFPKRAAADPLRRPIIDARPKLAEMPVAERRAVMQERYDARVAEARHAIDNADCPTCRVDRYNPCVSTAGKPYSNVAHVGRIVRARRTPTA